MFLSDFQVGPKRSLDSVEDLRKDFPYFSNGAAVYLDSGSTAQKPLCVLEAMDEYNTKYCANIHRGAHGLGNKATEAFENVRQNIADFINAKSKDEIVFTKGATDGINTVAHAYAKESVNHVICTSLEHHSNIVPWQHIGAKVEAIKTLDNLLPDLNHFESLLKKYPGAMVALIHTSNAFGVTNPIRQMIQIAHEYGSKVLIDASQSTVHRAVDVQKLDVDFLVMSAHKLYGPTGVGALYIKESLHDECKPYQGGGGAIKTVSFNKTEYMPIPYMYEAGTSNIAGVIGFGAAIDYIKDIGFERLQNQEKDLIAYTFDKLLDIEDVQIYTEPHMVSGNISFNIKGIHHHDLGILLDKQKVEVRVGHHCVQPAMQMLGIDGTVRISFGLYTSKSDIDTFFKALHRAVKMLKAKMDD